MINQLQLYPIRKHYGSGPAELLNHRKLRNVKGLQVIFDSGSTYTYFSSKAYEAVLNQVGGGFSWTCNSLLSRFTSFQLTSLIQLRGDLSRKPLKDATEDKSLPVCWKGTKPFKSVNDVKAQFKPLVLSFAKNVQYEIPPEAYLVITVSTYLSFSRPRRVLWRPIV